MNATSNKDTVLNVSGISKRFGGLQALSDVGITIQRGQVYGLIGPNGAGKTTFFNVITGLYTPDSGTFELAGQPYQPTAVHEVAKAGIARTFQNIRLFAEMTALENVMVGRHVRTHSGLLGAIFRTPTHPWDRGDNRGAPRQDTRQDAPRQAGGRWEDRGGDNRNSARPAPRGAAGDKFARGPKQFGASNFKPHGAAGEGPAGKRGGTRVLKITRG